MPTGVYIRTEVARLSYSKAFKGRVPWNKGIKTGPQPAELIEARREWMRGNKHSNGIKRDDDFKARVSKGMTGRKCTKTHCKNISKAKKGSNNPNWKGGLESDPKHRNARSLVNVHKRHSRIKNTGGSFSLEEWNELKKKYGYRCPKCGKKEPDIKLTVDHIIPISKGGNSFISNIQPLCGICNCKKFNKESEAICKQLYL
jgi:5-methylcytosine-specific restriction endonuclease McrA